MVEKMLPPRLLAWLKDQTEISALRIDPLQQEASTRRYYRVKMPKDTWILADGSGEPEAMVSFVRAAKVLHSLGWRVPVIYRQDLQAGFLLQEDLGQVLLEELLGGSSQQTFLNLALQDLGLLQQSAAHFPTMPLPEFNWVLYEGRITSAFTSVPSFLQIQPILKQLLAAVKAQPIVLCHRDFHSRNMLVLPTGKLAHIDFQMLCWGPMAYDVASLLYDAYVVLSEEVREIVLKDYYEALQKHSVLSANYAVFKMAVREAALLRHLRCIPLFKRLQENHPQGPYRRAYQTACQYVQVLLKDLTVYQELRWLLEAYS